MIWILALAGIVLIFWFGLFCIEHLGPRALLCYEEFMQKCGRKMSDDSAILQRKLRCQENGLPEALVGVYSGIARQPAWLNDVEGLTLLEAKLDGGRERIVFTFHGVQFEIYRNPDDFTPEPEPAVYDGFIRLSNHEGTQLMEISVKTPDEFSRRPEMIGVSAYIPGNWESGLLELHRIVAAMVRQASQDWTGREQADERKRWGIDGA